MLTAPGTACRAKAGAAAPVTASTGTRPATAAVERILSIGVPACPTRTHRRMCATLRSRLYQDTRKYEEPGPDHLSLPAPMALLAAGVSDMRIGLQIPDFSGAGGAQQLGSQLAAVART